MKKHAKQTNLKKAFAKLPVIQKSLLIIAGIAIVAVAGYAAAPIAGCNSPVNYADRTAIAGIPYETVNLKDGTQDQGQTKVKIAGVDGSQSFTQRFIYQCNVVITKKPIQQQMLVGTKHLITEPGPAVPYSQVRVVDNSLSRDQTNTKTHGVNGETTLTYQISQDEGQPEVKQLVKTEVTKPPINEVVGYGPACDPNYTGACVPNVYPQDVDCSSGNGNGPYYVRGPVRVVGVDRYGLDRGGSGIGCERG